MGRPFVVLFSPGENRATLVTSHVKGKMKMFTHHIEAKPDGGFIAHASDPNLPPLEAPSRMELQQKIQAKISATLTAEFPGLKLPAESQQQVLDFHIEAKPGGGFLLHSSDPNAAPVEGATHEEIEHPFAEKVAGALGKYFLPELSEALRKQGNVGDVKVFVNRKVGFAVGTGSHQLTFGKTQDLKNSPALQAEGLEPAASNHTPDANPTNHASAAHTAPTLRLSHHTPAPL